MLEVVLGLVELAAGVGAGRVVAVAVGRGVVIVAPVLAVGLGGVVLAPVAVVLGAAGDPVPGVLGGVLGVAPGQAGLALGLLPAVLEIVLGVVELAPGIGARRGVAVLVSRLEVVVRAVRRVRALRVVVAPVGVLLGGVDPLGHALAGEPAGDAADGRSDHRSHRAAHGRADRRTGHRAAGRADSGADRMRAGLAGDRVEVRISLVEDGGGGLVGRVNFLVFVHGVISQLSLSLQVTNLRGRIQLQS